MVDLSAHNCDTLLDSAVTVHPIHVGRGVVTANTLVGVHTPTVNGRDLTLPTRTQTSEQE